MVRMAMMKAWITMAMGFGTRLVADRKDKGMENTAPTMVPKKAMHMGSSSR